MHNTRARENATLRIRRSLDTNILRRVNTRGYIVRNISRSSRKPTDILLKYIVEKKSNARG